MRKASFLLIVITLLLTCFGILMISTAGTAQAVKQGLLEGYYFIKQIQFSIAALVFGIIIAVIPYKTYAWKPMPVVLFIGMAGALLLTFLMATDIKGSARWLKIGGLSLQISEFVKIGVILMLSSYFSNLGGLVNRYVRGFFIPIAAVGILALFLLKQPDFGSTMILCGISSVIFLLGGVSIKKVLTFAVIGGLAVGALLLHDENRLNRLANHSNNPQTQNAAVAFHNGGWDGVGLGKGKQKLLYLAESHTDFIFAIVGEDLGYIATALLLICYVIILVCGTYISYHAGDKQGMLIAYGCTLVIAAQAAANIAVVTHIFPTKGLALPFISYGGSCLLASFAATGLLCNVATHSANLKLKPERRRVITKI